MLHAAFSRRGRLGINNQQPTVPKIFTEPNAIYLPCPRRRAQPLVVESGCQPRHRNHGKETHTPDCASFLLTPCPNNHNHVLHHQLALETRSCCAHGASPYCGAVQEHIPLQPEGPIRPPSEAALDSGTAEWLCHRRLISDTMGRARLETRPQWLKAVIGQFPIALQCLDLSRAEK